LLGGSQNDRLFGDVGSDTLPGGNENDLLFDGSQADFLQGGLGRDVLRGGSGADVFNFASASETVAGRAKPDVIEDFRADRDQIDLHRIANGQAFTGNAAFNANSDAQVRYDRITGLLTGDTNGDGFLDYQIKLGDGNALVQSDLIL